MATDGVCICRLKKFIKNWWGKTAHKQAIFSVKVTHWPAGPFHSKSAEGSRTVEQDRPICSEQARRHTAVWFRREHQNYTRKPRTFTLRCPAAIMGTDSPHWAALQVRFPEILPLLPLCRKSYFRSSSTSSSHSRLRGCSAHQRLSPQVTDLAPKLKEQVSGNKKSMLKLHRRQELLHNIPISTQPQNLLTLNIHRHH